MTTMTVHVEVYQRGDADFGWRLVDDGNHARLAIGGEGFTERNKARGSWYSILDKLGVSRDAVPIVDIDYVEGE